MSINNVIVSGRVGRAPDVKYLDNGNTVANFPLAINQRAKGEDTTIWVDVACWNKSAQFVADHVVKGSPIGVVGRLDAPDAWIDRNSGEARVKLKIVADRLEFLGPKPDGQSSQSLQAQPAYGTSAGADIPF